MTDEHLEHVHSGVRGDGTGHDTAGVPFRGRQVTSTGFDDDDGAADGELLRALADRDEAAWMDRLPETRLLVPIVAAPTEVDETGGLAVEKSTDMAVVTLTAPDGTKGLPVFTSLEALAAWDPSARPSPVRASFAAQAAIAESCQVLLLDMASEHRVVVRSSMLWALAQQQKWLPVHRDLFIHRAVERAAAPHPEVRSVELEDAGEGVLGIRLAVEAGQEQHDLERIATSVGESLAADGETRARIEGLAFSFVRSASDG